MFQLGQGTRPAVHSAVIFSLSKHSVSTAIYFSEEIKQYPKCLLLEKQILVSEQQESPGICQV